MREGRHSSMNRSEATHSEFRPPLAAWLKECNRCLENRPGDRDAARAAVLVSSRPGRFGTSVPIASHTDQRHLLDIAADAGSLRETLHTSMHAPLGEFAASPRRTVHAALSERRHGAITRWSLHAVANQNANPFWKLCQPMSSRAAVLHPRCSIYLGGTLGRPRFRAHCPIKAGATASNTYSYSCCMHSLDKRYAAASHWTSRTGEDTSHEAGDREVAAFRAIARLTGLCRFLNGLLTVRHSECVAVIAAPPPLNVRCINVRPAGGAGWRSGNGEARSVYTSVVARSAPCAIRVTDC